MTGRGTLRIVVSMALLFLAWQVAGGDRVLRLLASAQWPWLVLALLLTVPMQLISALRWTFTSERIGDPLPFRRALAEYYLASLINMTLPGGVTGDAARIWRQGQRACGLRRAAHGVLLERSAGQAALIVVFLVGIACHPGQTAALVNGGWLAPVLLVIGALLVTALVAVRVVPRYWPAARDLVADARRAWLPGRVFAVQSLLSLGLVGVYLAIFAACARAFGAPLDPPTVLLAVPLVLTAMALPVSVGGAGPRELSAATLWPLFGQDAAAGAAAALAYGLVVLVGSLPGIAVPLRSMRPHGPGPA